MDTDTINISMSFKKDELVCCACHESLTKKIYQCANGNHYMCETCEPKWVKNECPTCRHPHRLVRNIFFEEQLKPHLKPCPNTGCTEKFFNWNTEHLCAFAPIKCGICKRAVTGNVDSYCIHLDGFCDESFKVIQVPSFDKRLKYKPNACSSVLKLPDKFVLIIRKARHSYRLSAVKNSDTEMENYKNVMCAYTRDGIEYNVTIPITNLNNTKIADVHFSEGEIAEFVFSKDIAIKQKLPTHTSPVGFAPTQRNFNESALFDSILGTNSGYNNRYVTTPTSDYSGNRSDLAELLRLFGNRT